MCKSMFKAQPGIQSPTYLSHGQRRKLGNSAHFANINFRWKGDKVIPFSQRWGTELYQIRAGGKTGSGGLTYAQGPHVTYGKNFWACAECRRLLFC